MCTLVIATKNDGKYLEFKKMLGPTSFSIKSLLDFPNIEIRETGLSFDDNALIKAKAVTKRVDLPALADDSGLEVQVLNGEPGIFTARYAGEHATDEDNIEKLLDKLRDVPLAQRQARFVCSLALVFPDGKTFLEQGILEGIITLKPRGIKGFGYDPVFFVPTLDKTLSEVSIDEKNRISHRARALEKIKKHLFKYM
jgi:XTP/dITP diphosphohydrolase